MTSGSLGSEMVSTLLWNARDVGSNPTLGGQYFPFSSDPRQHYATLNFTIIIPSGGMITIYADKGGHYSGTQSDIRSSISEPISSTHFFITGRSALSRGPFLDTQWSEWARNDA